MTQAFGNYQLIKKLATGGMAEVWLSRQTGIEGFNRHVVVKRILPHLAEDPEFVQMFLNEAKIASRFNHPNIAQIYDLGEHHGQYFIAMEFIHGEDLGRVMRRAWSTGQWVARHISLRIVADACQGLYYAHTRLDDRGQPLRVVHRDISPQNILISFDGAVKVVDFGIAKASDQVSNTKSGAIKGKFAYMAPEQAAGKPLDARSDIFALGLVLYELITGVRPLKRDSELATLQAALECKIDAPSAVAEVPPELDDIVMRALAKAPDDRYADAREFQRALEHFLLNAKELATSAEVSELMAALFADRLSEEARLGTPNPATESSTSNPIPSSYSAQAQAPASVTATPDPRPSRTDAPVRASPSMTMSGDEDPEVTGDGEGPRVGGGDFELPAGTVVPSRRYLNKKEVTVAGRASKEMTRMAPPDATNDDLPPVPAPRRRPTGMAKAVEPAPQDSEADLDPVGKRRPSSQFLPKRTKSGAMPEAPPRSRSRASNVSAPEVKPSRDGISAYVDVKGLQQAQRSRLKALVSVVLLVAALGVAFVFRDQVLGALNHRSLSDDGVPVRLSVTTNPPTVVFVVPGPRANPARKVLELGRTPIDEQSGAFAGDIIRMTNADRGINFEQTVDFVEPNSLVRISKEFKESFVKFKTSPPIKGGGIYRGPFKLGELGVKINLYPGTQQLELRSDALKDAVPFTITFTEERKNIDWPIDVSGALQK